MKITKENEVVNYSKLFIGGEWKEPSTNNILELKSPHDQSVIGSTPEAAKADIDSAVASARRAFDYGIWPKLNPQERQEIVERFNELHSQYAEKLAALTTRENGAPIWFTSMLQTSVKEQTSAYIRAAKVYPWEVEQPSDTVQKTVLRSEPIGVVAAIIPWNAPQQSALVKIIPALLAGCTVVLKPSPETALDGIALGEIFKEAGLPDGTLSIVPAGREVSEYLVSHPDVDKIAFTGSTGAGRKIASIAGFQLKRFSLELGGKSAAIILEDADLESVVGILKYASFSNNGESCVSQTRILAPESRYDEIVEALAVMVSEISVGDPEDVNTFVGPMVNEQQFNRVKSYITLGQQEGARIVSGGEGFPEGKGLEDGFYVKPTIFADVNNNMRIAREEIFGPVVVVIPYKDEADAIRISNDSDYGLSGSVFTKNRERGLEIARQIRTGRISINDNFGNFDSPFGGYKQSGIGREFGSFGISEYVEQKAIFI